MVFLDKMDIEYHYEPEGFQFEDGTRYLPDFYLPNIRMYAEVKPHDLTEEERNKAYKLVREGHVGIIFLIGPPEFTTYDALFWDCGEVTKTDVLLDIWAHNGKYYREQRRLFCDPWDQFHRQITEDRLIDFSGQCHSAIEAARSARFGAF